MKYCTCNRRRNPRRLRRRNPKGGRSYLTRLTEGFEALNEEEPEGTRSGQIREVYDLARPFVGRRPANASYFARLGTVETPPLASAGMQGLFTGSPRATRAFPDAPRKGRSGRLPTKEHSRRRNRRFRYNPCSSDHKRRPRRFNPEFNVTPTIFDHADDRAGVGRRWGGVTFKRSRSTDREPDVWDRAVEDYKAEWGKDSLGESRRRLRRRNPGFDSPFSPIYKNNPG